MAAIIFWTVIILVVFFTVGFMACAVGEYFSNNLEKRISLNQWKWKFIAFDVVPVLAMLLFWIL